MEVMDDGVEVLGAEMGLMYSERLRETLPRVRDAIEEAARRGGRTGAAVTLVAVTKGHPPAAVRAALAAGVSDIGENRVEELEVKVGALEDSRTPRWHMIGHLQRRKAPRVIGICDLLHSVDTVRLAERLDRFVPADAAPLPVLVQVNTSGEAAKSGLALDEAREGVHRIAQLPGLAVRGLMTMAPLTDREHVLRRAFGNLRRLHEDLGSQEAYRGEHLSMGMTNDFRIAIEEGGTMVRIGTALLGPRPQRPAPRAGATG